jgi:hypothetical protein
MADSILTRIRNALNTVAIRLKDMGDGSYAEAVSLAADLRTGAARSLTLSLAAGVADVLLPDDAVLLGVKAPVAGVRMNLAEAPVAKGTASGAGVAAAAFTKGVDVPTDAMQWNNLPMGNGRHLYFTGPGVTAIELEVR